MNVTSVFGLLDRWIAPYRAQEDIPSAARALAVALGAAFLRDREELPASWQELPLLAAQALRERSADVIQRVVDAELQREAHVALVLADADQIQPYVFESTKIAEARGASALVDSLHCRGTRAVARILGLPGDAIIYDGGGTALLLVPAAVADEATALMERWLSDTTLVATLTAVTRRLSLGEILDHFPAVREDLNRQLQIAKLTRRPPSRYEWLPFARRCTACEVRPAVREYVKAADHAPLCEACARKRDKGGARALIRNFLGYLEAEWEAGSPPPYLADLPGARPEPPARRRWLERVRRAEDFEELAAGGRLGVIAADGDDMGQILKRLASLDELGHFSRGVTRLAATAVHRSLAGVLRAKPVRPGSGSNGGRLGYHPFELVTLGGDDVFLIVPGDRALAVAKALAKEWQARAPEVLPPGRDDLAVPSLSLGILICPHTLPLYFMHELADQLLQHAKTARRRAGVTDEGFIDFLLLASSSVPRTEAERIRKALYHTVEPDGSDRTAEADQLRLTRRPYSLSHFTELCDQAAQVRAGISRSQRAALAHGLYQGRLRSTAQLLFFLARETKPEDALRTAILTPPGSDGSQQAPWRREPARSHRVWSTHILDLLELAEVVEETT